jgi:hypothetical protein
MAYGSRHITLLIGMSFDEKRRNGLGKMAGQGAFFRRLPWLFCGLSRSRLDKSPTAISEYVLGSVALFLLPAAITDYVQVGGEILGMGIFLEVCDYWKHSVSYLCR